MNQRATSYLYYRYECVMKQVSRSTKQAQRPEPLGGLVGHFSTALQADGEKDEKKQITVVETSAYLWLHREQREG